MSKKWSKLSKSVIFGSKFGKNDPFWPSESRGSNHFWKILKIFSLITPKSFSTFCKIPKISRALALYFCHFEHFSPFWGQKSPQNRPKWPFWPFFAGLWPCVFGDFCPKMGSGTPKITILAPFCTALALHFCQKWGPGGSKMAFWVHFAGLWPCVFSEFWPQNRPVLGIWDFFLRISEILKIFLKR